MTKPITPEQVQIQKGSSIPDAVYEVVNQLLIKKFSAGRATLMQDDIVEGIVARMGVSRASIFDNGWLDIESAYESVGWHVTYDKPAYNETYKASFCFTRKIIR
jgi:hypothetical protein